MAKIPNGVSQVYIGDIRVDASISEQHALRGEITTHKVEVGSDIADHYRTLPKQITIDGIISNLSLYGPTPTDTGTEVVPTPGSKTPVLDVWKRLKGIFNKNELVTIKTSLDTYNNMALTAVSVTRGSHNGDNLNFSATAKEVIFATAKYTEQVEIPKSTRGKKKEEKGKNTNRDDAPLIPLNTEGPPSTLWDAWKGQSTPAQ